MDSFELSFRVYCKLTWNQGVFTLSLGDSGGGRDYRHVAIESISNVHLYSDNSIIEIYLNGGEEVFTSRIYNNQLDKNLSLVGTGYASLTKWSLSNK